ncbi:cation-translocating P-type ATPase [Mycobacterium paraseoulense]|uniref:Haloacid dehalogenase n=1 Tax=Mycobacterium paraseoulense TaxID=590652 RepID=A0A1X0IFW0_9MYCO|nr:cation-translocating P-type ATPase [Mycobacterium paraseoulense]MCV7394043.1 cation-translocating P-type ATPase [Mycobacterium paraseoulense]ORB45199.1 haloacid dehalogenase [Mycobacterium paraseoulense]BBZ73796.1 haloacid dehalogenase [Mycobacterium paraseoulense]
MDAALLDPDPALLDVTAVVARLRTDPEAGLTTAEAARRLAVVGANDIDTVPPAPAYRRLLAQFRSPLIYLLLAALVASLAVWVVEGAGDWPVDAVVIAVILVLNAILGYAQEARAERAVGALARMAATSATVVRDGARRAVPASEVVPGDVLLLTEGDAVAADARLLSSAGLEVSEAALTGLSEPVLKDARTLAEPAALGDRADMVFKGTAVTKGVGRAVVTATAMATQTGQIAGLVRTADHEPTPLQREVARASRLLGIAVLVIAVVVIATIVVVFGIHSAHDAVTAALLGVSLAVAAVPEGLPAIMSVVLALGMRRMAGLNAVVKELSSAETLGSASVVCSGKTGTLTTGEMTIVRVITLLGEVRVTGAGYRPEGRLEHGGAPLGEGDDLWRQAALVLDAGAAAGRDAALDVQDGRWTARGDPVDAAFVVARGKLGDGPRPTPADVTTGDPDELLGRCTHLQAGDRLAPLDDPARATIRSDAERLAFDALHTVAVACRSDGHLVYLGMVGITDPPRPAAAAAIAEARRAGVRVVMITGDHPRVAARIARKLGIEDGESAVSGAQLATLDDEQLRETVRLHSQYTQVDPADKQRIIDALHADHEIVAVTGEGINDAPALKSADIGIAMGRSGTDVAREAANMILADDNFATIVQAIREGRGIFANIKKSLRYLLSSNMGEIFTVFFGVVLAGTVGLSQGGTVALPLLATQILWINLLTDGAPALALGVDPQTEEVMSRPPRSVSDRVIDARMWNNIIVIGAAVAAATLFTIRLYAPGGPLPSSLDTARTAGFTVLVIAQLINCINARSETRSAFHRFFANRWLWAAIGLSALLQVAVVQLPVLNTAFTTTPLSLSQWLVCIAMASTVLWVSEIRKLVLRRWTSRP